MKNPTPRNPGELRRLAEERLSERQVPRSALPVPRSDEQTLLELRVHQIELEMQNEELRTAQAEIEAGRERYFDLYDLAPVGYCTLSEKGLILEANLMAATLLGTARGALVKQPLSRFIAKDDQDDYYLHRKKLFETGESQEFDLRLVKTDGTLFWANLMATAAQAEDGTPVCRVVLSDITERKRAEQELRSAERHLRSTLDGLSAHIAVLDDRGEIILTNKSYRDFAERNGVEPGVVSEGTNYLAVCDTVSGEHSEEAKPFAKGIREVLEGKRPSFELEYPCHSPDEKRWFIGRVTPFAGGDSLGVVVAHENITERKQAVDALAASDMRFKELLQNVATVAVQGYALDGTVRYWNRAAETFYGYTAEEALGQNLLDLIIPPGMRDGVRAAIGRMAATGETIPASELELMRKDGSLITLYSSHALVQLPGQEPELFCIDIDLTELKQTEKERERLQAQLLQAQKMEAIGRLAGGVAHDFNNLLMGIMNYTELCRDRIEPGHPIRTWLDEITSESERSAKLTRQLLAFARKQAIVPEVLNLNDEVETMLKMLRRLIGENIDVAWLPASGAWPVRMDHVQIDLILTNLLVNARDAIAGAGRITIETGNRAFDAAYCTGYEGFLPGDYTMLAVSDDGCGMDRETLDHLFEPFFTTKGVGEGTGLGLATVYGIVKQNNGFVNVYSEPGKGTTFRIYLPRCAGAVAAREEAVKPADPTGGHETILLVEDDKSVRVTTRLFLEQFGYTVLAAESPQDALRVVGEKAGTIDLLVTDVVMPGMNGRELAERMAADHPSMKVLYMSGYTAAVIANCDILDSGVNFLGKPVARDTIARKVREVLDQTESDTETGP